MRVFRRGGSAAPSLTSYLGDLYFRNPWHDAGIPSLVYDLEGKVAGFIGALPFPMRLNGEKILSAIGGNYMVDPELKNPLAGVRLLKKFFEGRQDLTMTDTANETGHKMWEGLGATTLHLFSMQWLRVLRPARFAVSLVQRRPLLSFLGTLSRPVGFLVDRVAPLPAQSPFRVTASNLESSELDTGTLLRAVREFSARLAFAPDYTERSLGWLLEMAGRKKEYGPLYKVALRGQSGELVGWYMYYPGDGRKPGQVLQFVAKPAHMDHALAHLFSHACDRGSFALVGRPDPHFIREYFVQRCFLGHLGVHVQVHSRRPGIVETLAQGKGFLTRLEGEWWTRLQGDAFNGE